MDFEQFLRYIDDFDIIDPYAPKCSSKWWENNDLEQYAVLGAEALESANIVRLGENMMIGLTSRDSDRLAHIIAVLAVHIRKPDWTTRLIPAEVLADKQQQIESLTDSDFLEQLEQKTGRLACLQVTKAGATPLVLRELNPNDLCYVDQSTKDKILSAESTLVAFITSIRIWDIELQACWYTFLAACICRVISKTPAVVRKLVTGVLFTRFRQFYGAPMVQTPVPEPQETKLTFISNSLKPCRELCRFVITSFLKGLGLSVVEKDTRCRGILEFSLLVHTSYNGLQLIGLLYQVMDALGIRDVEQVIKQIGIKEKSLKGLEFIREYCNRYGTSSRWLPASKGATHVPDEANHPPFQLWSRLLDNDYLSDLRLKNDKSDNQALAAIFCAVIDPDVTEGGVWSMPGLEMTKDNQKFYCDIIRKWMAKIRKNANKSPKPQ